MSDPVIHVIGVPTPMAAGHAINFYNVASTIASKSLIVHSLCTSQKSAKQYLESCGQADNPNIIIDVLADGQWEDSHEHLPRRIIQFLMGPEFAAAIRAKLAELTETYSKPSHKFTAMLIPSPLGGSLPLLTKEYQLRTYALFPNPLYMLGLANAIGQGDDMQTTYEMFGLGSVDAGMAMKAGDAPDLLSPFNRDLMMNSIKETDGAICSGTNIAIEGREWKQPHLAVNLGNFKSTFLIGPLMPTWFLQALDKPGQRTAAVRAVPNDQAECIKFMNRQLAKSTVYISIGSHAEFSVDQGVLLISVLRRLRVPYVMRKKDGNPELIKALEHDGSDGIITEWAPQLEILAHPALKCFISHAGFGSMVEGIIAGVPFITVPSASDQFLDEVVLRNLGVSLGMISVNKFRTQHERVDIYPIFPDDGGVYVEKVLQDVLGTAEGEVKLGKARQKALEWRKRILDARETDATQELAALKQALTA